MSHFSISIFKSVIRITASLILFFGTTNHFVSVFAMLFLFAEILGIAEEIFDKRKEK